MSRNAMHLIGAWADAALSAEVGLAEEPEWETALASVRFKVDTDATHVVALTMALPMDDGTSIVAKPVHDTATVWTVTREQVSEVVAEAVRSIHELWVARG